MKNLLFHELSLTSELERTARRIPLDPKATVIKGGNDTGKSSLLKSLYRTLGTEPSNHPKWRAANVVSSLRFSLDGVAYRMLRVGGRHVLFDGRDQLIRSFSHVTTELAPFFSELFDFRLMLRSRNRDAETQAVPAFLFLPFYIDQDLGWNRTLSSFERLNQFQSFRTDVVYFHTGLRPGAYYTAKARASESTQDLRLKRAERENRDYMLQGIEQRLAAIDFDIDLESYQDEVTRLLERCQALRDTEEQQKQRMNDAYNLKRAIEDQVNTVKSALEELRDDRLFAAETANPVICPTCHAVYPNGFAERFQIALDEDGCLSLLDELDVELQVANEKWDAIRSSVRDAKAMTTEIEQLLATKRGKIALIDVLRREGQKDVATSLRADMDDLAKEIGLLDKAVSDAKTTMHESEDKTRQSEIKDFYFKQISRLLNRLDVMNIPESDYKRIDFAVHESGSDLPRAILGYQFALLGTISKYSTSTFCPIVIDSPRQQDQDEVNWQAILEFIRDERPADSQLILAVADDKGVDFGGKVIDLTNKYHLLDDGDYGDVSEELRPLIERSLNA